MNQTKSKHIFALLGILKTNNRLIFRNSVHRLITKAIKLNIDRMRQTIASFGSIWFHIAFQVLKHPSGLSG